MVVGSTCDIRAAIDNYGSNESGGTWFSFLELLKLDGQPRSWSLPVTNSSFNLDSLEAEINSELQNSELEEVV